MADSEHAPLMRAAWRHLAMVNYEGQPRLLAPLVPPGSELDTYEGRTLVSMVGFLFQDSRLLGVPLPFHRQFEEINLRFYVKRAAPGGTRHGVVFVREIVSRPLVSWAARALYGEPYVTYPTRHRLDLSGNPPWTRSAEYSWTRKGRDERLKVVAAVEPRVAEPGSFEEFVTLRE